jgi:hypothetical protein
VPGSGRAYACTAAEPLNQDMRAQAKQALENAAGPTPWWTASLPKIAHRNLAWRRDDGTSRSVLDRNGIPVLSLGFYCYTLAFRDHMLIWHARGKATAPDALHVEIYDLETLVTRLGEDPQQYRGSIQTESTPTAVLDLKPLLEGSRECVFPQEMLGLDELFLFFNSSPTALWHLQPAHSRITAYPQDWFNTGDWDYGYQWPTRVKRDPATRLVFGEGIRIGYFALDPTMRNLLWRQP